MKMITIIIIAAVVAVAVVACDGSGSKTTIRHHTATVRYCPGGVCADGTIVESEGSE